MDTLPGVSTLSQSLWLQDDEGERDQLRTWQKILFIFQTSPPIRPNPVKEPPPPPGYPLKKNIIFYNENKSEEICHIPLEDIIEISVVNTQTINTFRIKTKERNFILRANTREDYENFVGIIENLKKENSFLPEHRKVSRSDFDKIKCIGRGAYSFVWLVRERETGKVYAMKEMSKRILIERDVVKHILQERHVLSHLSHPFLIKIYYAFQTHHHLYLILEFVNGGNLLGYLQIEGSFSEKKIQFFTAELLVLLVYLHKNNVLYRDLKPEHILLNDKGHIVACDFGFCKSLRSEREKTKSFCGTVEYLAPEVIGGKDYSFEVDYWALGTVIWEMATGSPPFFSDNIQDIYSNILVRDLVAPSYFSPELFDLTRKLLDRDPTTRLQDPEMIKAHPFFKGIDWQAIERLETTPPILPVVKADDDVVNINEELLAFPIPKNDMDPWLDWMEEDGEIEEGLERFGTGFRCGIDSSGGSAQEEPIVKDERWAGWELPS